MKALKDLNRYWRDPAGKLIIDKLGVLCYFSDVESILPKWISVDVLPEKHGWYYCRIVGDTENSYDTYYGAMYNDDTKIGWESEITYWLDNVPPAPEAEE